MAVFRYRFGIIAVLAILWAVPQAFAQGETADLDLPFVLEMSGKVNKAGRLEPSATKYTRTEGRKPVLDALKRAVDEIDKAGYFRYLAQVEPANGDFVLRAVQDGKAFDGAVMFDLANENRARTAVSGLTAMLAVARSRVSAQDLGQSRDGMLLSSARAVSEGKTVVVSITLPKRAFREILEHRMSVEKDTTGR